MKHAEEYTPYWLISRLNSWIGKIHTDPFTSKLANDKIVHAKNYFTKEQDGFKREWHGTVWIAPPKHLTSSGTRINSKFLSEVFRKAVKEWHAGRMTRGVIFFQNCNNLPYMDINIAFPVFYLSKPIRHLIPDKTGGLTEMLVDSWGWCMVYIPDPSDKLSWFENQMGDLGTFGWVGSLRRPIYIS